MRKSLIVAGLLIVSTAVAAPPASQPDWSDEQLRLLVAQLDDPSYQTRQMASDKLSRLDSHQIGRLVPLYKSATQPEQRFRLREAAQAIFIAGKRSALGEEGFLGLAHRQGVRTENGEQLAVVEVSDVMPDSPAAKAGLKPGDVITTLFGQRISQDAGETFAEKIRRMAPGAPVKLHVVRGEDRLDIIVTLADRATASLAEEIPAEWRSQFQRLWQDKFDPNDAMDRPSP